MLHVTQSSTTLVQWLALPLLSCTDNVIAEAHACLAAIELAFNYYESCLSKGTVVDSIVIQGDILPIINYLQHRGRVKKPAVVAILDQCQHLLAYSALSTYHKNAINLRTTLPVRATGDPLVPLHYVAPPPYQLAQSLGFIVEQGDRAQSRAFVLTECPSPAPQELNMLLRLHPHYKFVTLDYLTASVASAHRLTVGYKPTVIAQGGRYYAVGNTAQRLPRQVRLLLFGNSHWEIDISGAHYELMRRLCKAVEVHLDLPPITQARLSLREAIGNQVAEGDIDQLVKTWPLVIINSATPQEAAEYLRKRLTREVPPSLVRFAREVFAASRYVMHHPPTWCPPVPARVGRGAPFHFFEVLEQHAAWTAYSFLQAHVGFTSVIWLHDGFWVSPRPGDDALTSLHSHLCQVLGFDPADAPLMRCDPLQEKRNSVLAQCASPVPTLGLLSQAPSRQPLPPVVRIHRKRTFVVAHLARQEALEQRLAKRARVADVKRRRLI